MDDIDTHRRKTLQLDAKASSVGTLANSREKLKLFMVNEDQLDQIVDHKNSIEAQLLWAAPGICIGSATGSISALVTFMAHKALSLEGFIQNMFFFSSLTVTITLLVIYWPKRNAFKRLIDSIRSRMVRD